MTISIRDSLGFPHAIAKIAIRDDSGTLRDIAFLKIRDASNTLRTVWQKLTASVSTTFVSATGGYGITGNVTASASWGTAPYSFLWTINSPDPEWYIQNPTQPTTNFAYSTALPTSTAYFTCQVTDANGLTANSPSVQARYRATGGFE